jgi:hypothetical protein
MYALKLFEKRASSNLEIGLTVLNFSQHLSSRYQNEAAQEIKFPDQKPSRQQKH